MNVSYRSFVIWWLLAASVSAALLFFGFWGSAQMFFLSVAAGVFGCGRRFALDHRVEMPKRIAWRAAVVMTLIVFLALSAYIIASFWLVDLGIRSQFLSIAEIIVKGFLNIALIVFLITGSTLGDASIIVLLILCLLAITLLIARFFLTAVVREYLHRLEQKE